MCLYVEHPLLTPCL